MAGAYPGICSVMQLRVLLLPPWMGCCNPSQGYLQQYVVATHFIHLGGERQLMWGKVSCLRIQHDVRDWVLNHQPSDLKSNVLTTTPPCPHTY